MALRWGIISTGKISSDFVNALKTLHSSEHEITAVAASEEQKAKEFAAKHNISIVCKNYAEMGTGPVDVVYIGTINTLHYSIAKEMIQNGKHVLCEKPLCIRLNDTKELIKLAKEKNVFLMEAIWSRCFPIYKKLRQILNYGIIGEIHHVQASFGIQIAESPRLMTKELGGGTILDLGVYVLQFALLIFGDKQKKISSFGSLNSEGVDVCTTIVLEYKDGKYACLNTHSKVEMKESAKIYGSLGKIEIVHPFWCPTDMIVTMNDNKTTHIKEAIPKSNKIFNYVNSSGLAYEAQEVRKCLQEGLKESSLITLDESVAIAELQQAVMDEIGMKFE